MDNIDELETGYIAKSGNVCTIYLVAKFKNIKNEIFKITNTALPNEYKYKYTYYDLTTKLFNTENVGSHFRCWIGDDGYIYIYSPKSFTPIASFYITGAYISN
jgi:hypothetical protein